MTEKPRAKHARGYVHSVDHHSDLELALAPDILRTVMIPTRDEIGKLEAIVVLRTVLNYFLERAIEQEQKKAEYVVESAA